MRPRLLAALGLLLLLNAGAWAANNVYVDTACSTCTPVTFGDSGKTVTVTYSTLAVAGTTPGRVSPQLDRTAAAHANCYFWTAQVALEGTNVLDQTVDFYVAQAMSTTVIPGGIGTADANLTSLNQLPALRLIGSLVVYQTTTRTLMYAGGEFCSPARYLSIVVSNKTALPFTSTANGAAVVTLQPYSMQVQ